MAVLVQIQSALVVCKGCGKTVPKTNLCVYCGAPIMFKMRLTP